jgi:hypothetical protein
MKYMGNHRRSLSADEKLTAFLKLESQIASNEVTRSD